MKCDISHFAVSYSNVNEANNCNEFERKAVLSNVTSDTKIETASSSKENDAAYLNKTNDKLNGPKSDASSLLEVTQKRISSNGNDGTKKRRNVCFNNKRSIRFIPPNPILLPRKADESGAKKQKKERARFSTRKRRQM